MRFYDITNDILDEIVPLDEAGIAVYGWSIPRSYPTGALTLKAEFTGSGQFAPSNDQDILSVESVYAASVGLTLIPSIAKISESIHLTAHVSRMEFRYPLTGVVEFYHVEEGRFLGDHSIDEITGNASIDWVIPPNYGQYMGASLTIRADYIGNLYFESASTTTSIQLEVTAYSTETIFTITANSATPGTPITLKAQITALQPGFNPTGDVSFYDATNLDALGTVTLNAQGVAEFTWTIPTNQQPGNVEIRASYLGEPSGLFVPSSQTKQLHVKHFPSSIQLILSETEVWVGDSIEIEVEVSGIGTTHTPQGTVALRDKTNNYVLDTLTLDAKGKARKTWIVPNTYADGSIELDAAYSGDAWLYPSNSAAFPQISNSAPVIIMNVLENEVVNGTIDLEISISGISNTPDEQGVTLYVNQDPVPMEGTTGTYSLETETYPDGPFVLLVRGIDVLGNETVIERSIIIDNTAPELNLNIQNMMLVSGNLTIDFDIHDSSNTTLLFNGHLLQPDSPHIIDTLQLPDEEYLINVIVIDAVGHKTEVSRTVVIDNTPPKFTLVFDNQTQTLQVIVSDEHLYATSVYANSEPIIGIDHTIDGLEINSSTQFEVWLGVLAPGNYQVQIDSLDFVNNLGSDTIIIDIEVSDKTPSLPEPLLTTNPPLTSEVPSNSTLGGQTSPPDDSSPGDQKLMKNSFPLSILGFGVLGLGLFGVQKVTGKRGSSLVQRARESIN